MTKKELIEHLKDIPDDTQIRLIADHGQIPMKLTGCGYGYIEEDSYMPEERDAEELEGDELKVLVLEAF